MKVFNRNFNKEIFINDFVCDKNKDSHKFLSQNIKSFNILFPPKTVIDIEKTFDEMLEKVQKKLMLF
jgi:hypothetical protein